MGTFNIPQGKASEAMIGVGVGELISRLVVSFVGDYIKGHILKLYSIICVVLAVHSNLGSLAYSYLHFVIYGAGMYKSIQSV